MFQSSMDTVFAHAVTKVIELPQETQRFIGEAILDGAGRPDLPVIEFTAEEEAMIEDAEAEVARGELIDQEEVREHFDALRAKSYAAL